MSFWKRKWMCNKQHDAYKLFMKRNLIHKLRANGSNIATLSQVSNVIHFGTTHTSKAIQFDENETLSNIRNSTNVW